MLNVVQMTGLIRLSVSIQKPVTIYIIETETMTHCKVKRNETIAMGDVDDGEGGIIRQFNLLL